MIKEILVINALIALSACLPAVDPKQPVAPSVENSPIVVLAESDDGAEELETAETAHRGHHHHHHHHHHGHGHGHGYGHGFRGGYGGYGGYPVHRGYGGGGFGGGLGVGVGVAVGVGVGAGFHGRK